MQVQVTRTATKDYYYASGARAGDGEGMYGKGRIVCDVGNWMIILSLVLLSIDVVSSV